MPATFTRTPIDTERKDPGIGGKPPVDRRPTGGGGDGDNWDNRPGRRGPRDLLTRYRLSVLFALAGDLMFFVVLVSTFLVRQNIGHFDPHGRYVSDWRHLAVPPILWVNTAILLLSSGAMEMARRQLFREIDVMEEWLGLGRPTVRRAAPWIVATIVLGSLFLGGQWMAWTQLQSQGLDFNTTPNASFFYLITVTHAVHLVLGLLALAGSLAGLMLLRRVELRQIAVDCTAWYWHTMGLFWIFLFALLAFFQ
jgi:cytochrome c oxidase subunit 3